MYCDLSHLARRRFNRTGRHLDEYLDRYSNGDRPNQTIIKLRDDQSLPRKWLCYRAKHELFFDIEPETHRDSHFLKHFRKALTEGLNDEHRIDFDSIPTKPHGGGVG